MRRKSMASALIVAMAIGVPARAAGPYSSRQAIPLEPILRSVEDSSAIVQEPHVSRALSAGLAVTLGPFGAHRLYLGTKPKVPLIYGLTFGGFGVLVLIDLGHILFTRDLSACQENGQVLMWAKPRDGVVIPP